MLKGAIQVSASWRGEMVVDPSSGIRSMPLTDAAFVAFFGSA
jgi:hypothetical protein